jgi:hypothetical protein
MKTHRRANDLMTDCGIPKWGIEGNYWMTNDPARVSCLRCLRMQARRDKRLAKLVKVKG